MLLLDCKLREFGSAAMLVKQNVTVIENVTLLLYNCLSWHSQRSAV